MIHALLDIVLVLGCIIKLIIGKGSFSDHWTVWGLLFLAAADFVYSRYKHR